MMKWGRKKQFPFSSSSRAPHVSWFSKLSGSSDYLKPAKEKKQDDEASQKMSAISSLSCTQRRNDVHESSKRLQRVSVEKDNTAIRSADMESNEKFKEIMSRVKAIEDMKKAKLRAREHDGGGMEKESFAVEKCSIDPQKDFRDSMVEMIMENGIINHPEELKELLVCYLRLNTDEYHDMIINVFQQVHSDLNLH